MFRNRMLLATIAVAALVALVSAAQTMAKIKFNDWPMIGQDATNTRDQPFEHELKPSNVDRLKPKWVATTTGDVSATPAVVDGAVYFGDFGTSASSGGTLWKLDAETGKVIWSHSVPDYTGHRRRLRAHEPVARGQHARRRRHQGSDPAVSGPNMLGINATTERCAGRRRFTRIRRRP